MLDDLPVFGIGGLHGSGKTMVIEQLVPRLIAKGLKVVVVKHCAHRPDLDRPDKDSHKIFHSGADIFLDSAEEGVFRTHVTDDRDYSFTLEELCSFYDLVIIEGGKSIPVKKVWLTAIDETAPASVRGDVTVLLENSGIIVTIESIIDGWLPVQWMKPPVLGCVLIGGRSRRMGTPKHLLVHSGKTLLEHTVEHLNHVADTVVVVGNGEIPSGLSGIRRLEDIQGAGGPLAGILSAMRWAPHMTVLVAACDLADLSEGALEWLLSNRRPGVWAILPKLGGNSAVEPLLAHYDFRARSLLERLATVGSFSPSLIAGHPKVITVSPPVRLRGAWKNFNTPGDIGLQ